MIDAIGRSRWRWPLAAALTVVEILLLGLLWLHASPPFGAG